MVAIRRGFANLETLTTGEWWKRPGNNGKPAPGTQGAPPSMNVPGIKWWRSRCTHQGGVLKLSAQLFPSSPAKSARHDWNSLGQKWSVAGTEVHYPGWDAHFRIETGTTNDVKYRVCHGRRQIRGLIVAILRPR